jgi:hypothetical protein
VELFVVINTLRKFTMIGAGPDAARTGPVKWRRRRELGALPDGANDEWLAIHDKIYYTLTVRGMLSIAPRIHRTKIVLGEGH